MRRQDKVKRRKLKVKIIFEMAKIMKRYQRDKNDLVMTRDQVRRFDSWAINTLGISGAVLMENAGRSCAELIREKLSGIDKPKVVIFCGTGNNGGDGYVIARHLLNYGFSVVVVICGDREKIKGDAKINFDILQKLEVKVDQLDPDRIEALSADADMLVDALFGTGLRGRLRDEYICLIESLNGLNKPILAVDIPSGLDCDTGDVLGAAIKADHTVTFVAAKQGFAGSKKVSGYTGEIYVASIGINPQTPTIIRGEVIR
jgi:NAD(P)H-hydrate epimerase